MTDHAWMVIIISGFFFMTIGFFVVVGLLIYAIFEMKRTAAALDASLKSAEERLSPVLLETELCLRGVRKITDDVSAVTGSARNLADVSNEIVLNMKTLSSLISDLREGASLRAVAIRTGIKTAINVLMYQLKERR